MENERIITPEDAENEYGITTKYSEMPTNHEVRFRMNCSDGTAYIKTLTSKEMEGWQNAHYHKGLSETYIVGEGSIILAEVKNNKIICQEYNRGEVFTIKPNVSHNIYMRKGSTIHTVKHGKAVTSKDSVDWWCDSEECAKLNSIEIQDL